MKIIIAALVLPLVAAQSFPGENSFRELLKSYHFASGYDIPTSSQPSRRTYDFIVVGSGPGGSTVANRLSENPKWNVLLLEAGKPEGVLNQVPMLTFGASTDYDWGYKTEPQEHACRSWPNNQCNYVRGKSLGGSSSVNAMLYTRGTKLDWDNFAAFGNEGWSYDDVFPYFKKIEKLNIKGPVDMSYHGTDGYVHVESIPYRSELSAQFIKAGQEIGLKYVNDYNGKDQIGVSYYQATMDNGTRCSASKAYLRIERPNLDIVLNAHVTRTLINKNKQAYGVEYVTEGVTRQVRARKEVILSAGTIDSAKLLMLSGIGPREHLEELGIPVLKDSKVGYNFYDQVVFSGPVILVNKSVTVIGSRLFKPPVFDEYAARHNGPLTLPVGNEAVAFFRTKYAIDARPDMEIMFLDSYVGNLNVYGTNQDNNTIFKATENKDAFMFVPAGLNSRSFGRLTLRSKDPYEAPILQLNLLSNKIDVEVLLEGLKLAIQMTKTEAFQAYGAELHDIKIAGCEDWEFNTDDYWRCAISHLSSPGLHGVGTAKMGPKDDPDAVVDPQLRVYGISRLRVVDASIMPRVPVGHTTGPVYVVGEKAADMIKQSWECDL